MAVIMRWLKRILVALIVLVTIASIVPWAIPLLRSKEPLPDRPFDNSVQVEVGGVRIHGQAWPAARGDGAAACSFALVHGFAGSTYSWRELAPRLAARGHAVLAIDLPGFGYSERRNWTYEDGQGIWALLDAVRPGARWCLIGHSMGARIVAAAASRQPDRVDAVVYLGGGPLGRAESSFGQRLLGVLLRLPPVQRWIAVYADRRLFETERFAALLASAYGRTPTAAEVEGYLEPMRIEGTASAILERMASARATVDAAMIRRLPTLLLWGAVDTWVPPKVAEKTRQRLPGSQLVEITGAGHNPMETHPDATWRSLEAWLGTLPVAVAEQSRSKETTGHPSSTGE